MDRIHVSKDQFPVHGMEEVVLPQMANLTSIIDSASPDSFTDVLTAVGARSRDSGSPKGRPNLPTVMVVTRRRNDDLPGLTRDQIDVPHSNTNSLRHDTRSKGRFVGMDVFGNRLPVENNAGLGSPNMLTMPAAMTREEIMMLRAKQSRLSASTGSSGRPLEAGRQPVGGFDVPPPSQVNGVFVNTRSPNMPVRTAIAQSHGGSSLIGAVTDVVAQIRHNSHGVTRMPNRKKSFSRGHTRKPLVTVINSREFNNRHGLTNSPGVRHSTLQPRMRSQPSAQFVSQMNDLRRAFPNQGDWVRGDGMTSHRDAVRQAPHLDTHEFSTAEIRNHVPELPRNIGPRQDISSAVERRESANSVQSRENWFPNSQSFVQDRRMRMLDQAMAKTEPRDRSTSLPRRIVVHSMAIAQHLLRKYPQLRGRVFLSRQAHLRNKYAHVVNKYSRRQRWQ